VAKGTSWEWRSVVTNRSRSRMRGLEASGQEVPADHQGGECAYEAFSEMEPNHWAREGMDVKCLTLSSNGEHQGRIW
jgi:hypothetical protein